MWVAPWNPTGYTFPRLAKDVLEFPGSNLKELLYIQHDPHDLWQGAESREKETHYTTVSSEQQRLETNEVNVWSTLNYPKAPKHCLKAQRSIWWSIQTVTVLFHLSFPCLALYFRTNGWPLNRSAFKMKNAPITTFLIDHLCIVYWYRGRRWKRKESAVKSWIRQ